MKSNLLFFFFSFAIIIPTLQANIADFDDVWQKRADEAMRANLAAYHSNPMEVTDQINHHVHKYESFLYVFAALANCVFFSRKEMIYFCKSKLCYISNESKGYNMLTNWCWYVQGLWGDRQHEERLGKAHWSVFSDKPDRPVLEVQGWLGNQPQEASWLCPWLWPKYYRWEDGEILCSYWFIR